MKKYSNNPRATTAENLEKLHKNLEELGDLSGITHDLNSDEIITGNQRSTVFDINNCEIEIVKENKKPDAQGTVAVGFVVWGGNKYAYRQVRFTEEQRKKACVVANTFAGIWKFEGFEDSFGKQDLLDWGVPNKVIPKEERTVVNPSLEPAVTSDVQVVKIFFDKETEPQFREYINYLREKTGAKNLTEAIFNAVKEAYNDHS